MSEVKSQKSEVNARVEYARFSRSISVQQKSTPSLDFIATPDPNSQQEFLTYPNSIATGCTGFRGFLERISR